MKNRLLLILGAWLLGVACNAQVDPHLIKMVEGLITIRNAKASSEALNKAVIDWSASGCPKITLMDDIKRDQNNEYRGNSANKFKMNQVVTHVYSRQNIGMVSKGDYFNSTEKDVYYSAIEKTIKKGCKATFTLTGHIGVQEFVFIAFNPQTRFSAVVNGKPAKSVLGKAGILSIKIPRVKKEDKISFSISNESDLNESFVILNHNPQK